MATENRLYSRSEIRRELFNLGRNIQNFRDLHIAGRHISHQVPCDICRRMRGELIGLNYAIRHFGGRTELSVPGENQ